MGEVQRVGLVERGWGVEGARRAGHLKGQRMCHELDGRSHASRYLQRGVLIPDLILPDTIENIYHPETTKTFPLFKG